MGTFLLLALLHAEPSLPRPDLTCTTTADCALDWTYLVDGKCCDGTCTPRPVAKRYLDEVARQCKARGFATDCPTKKCAPLPPVECVSKRCVFVR